MLEILYFERRMFQVKAVQITEENIDAVARWCNGIIGIKFDARKDEFVEYIELTIQVNKNPQLAKAYFGQWITHNRSWRIYKPEVFEATFSPVDQMKFAKIRRLVAEAMELQDKATYDQNYKSVENTADAIATKILELI